MEKKQINNIINKKQETKKAFIKVIHFVNSFYPNQLNLSDDCRLHFKALIKCWQNEKQCGFNEFNNMKEHHFFITPELYNLHLWKTYIDLGHDFRTSYLSLLLIKRRLAK